MSTFDWGLGRYEDTAARLQPAARVVVERAAPAAGEHVVDVRCGTGNAALLAVERGTGVIGVDPAPRLLEVARREAAAPLLLGDGEARDRLGGGGGGKRLPSGAADPGVAVDALEFEIEVDVCVALHQQADEQLVLRVRLRLFD